MLLPSSPSGLCKLLSSNHPPLRLLESASPQNWPLPTHLRSAYQLCLCSVVLERLQRFGQEPPLCGSALLQEPSRLRRPFSQHHQHGFQSPQPWSLSLYTLQAVIIPLQKQMQTLEEENILQGLEQ